MPVRFCCPLVFTCVMLFFCLITAPNITRGQTFGIELHNNLMPASGGMAGVSISQPQDLQSAINANPATLAQFQGTQFSFGGAYAEPLYNVNQATPLPLIGVTPFDANSDTPGSLLGNIGVTRDLSFRGMNGTWGIAFLSNAGLGVDFRQIPASNGTQLTYLALDIATGVGFQLTERLSAGASAFIGTSILDGPFSQSSSSQTDYGTRFSVGLNYFVGCGTSLGCYYQSKKKFVFDNAVQFPGGAFQDVFLDHPANVGIGIANSCLMNGRLLLAADIVYKAHSEAALLKSIYRDQWILQLGSQLQVRPRVKLRTGYAYNMNPMLDQVPGTIGGVIPIGGIPAVQYIQGQFAAINQHRITAGLQIADIMPNCDFDIHAGGMFHASETFGSTTATVESYWIGIGMTWRFGNCYGCGAGCSGCVSCDGATSDQQPISFDQANQAYSNYTP